MIPRKQIDIGWGDLLAGIARSLLPADRQRWEDRVERLWDPSGSAVVTLSVRSGLDLLLRELRLPAGSEVLLSAITIRDMVRIVEAHGLVPVPVDLDMDTLSVRADRLEALVTPRTRLILVAHLFGSRMPLEAVAEVAERRGLLLVEDCAQAYVGPGWRGDPGADVSMFSFGPIKTNTALGGAVLRFRDPAWARRIREAQASLPLQSRGAFLARLLKYAVLRFLLLRLPFTLFVWGCRLAGRSHDEVIAGAVRGFAGAELLAAIRRRPSAPLLALLHRRIRGFRERSIAERIRAAEQGFGALGDPPRPGRSAFEHSHWVVPLLTDDPDAVAERLWRAGIDATRGASSLHVAPAPPGRPEADPVEARTAMARVLYLPLNPGARPRDLRRMVLR